METDDPFGNILQIILDPYAQESTEIALAEYKVAQAVELACKETLDEISDPALKSELITNLAQQLQAPLEEAVNNRIEWARSLYEDRIYNEGFEKGRLPRIVDPSPPPGLDRA